MASNPIFRKTIEELAEMIMEDIRLFESDYPEFDLDGKRKNIYKAHEFANKLRDFMDLDYFKGSLYKHVADIVGNLKFWAKDSKERIEKNKAKISEVRKIKKIKMAKGQISFFDMYKLTDDEVNRACGESDAFIQELKDENEQLEKDNKLARFCLYYLMNHNKLLRSIYEE